MITLEWDEMEDDRVLRIVCQDGVPLFLPTRYLLDGGWEGYFSLDRQDV